MLRELAGVDELVIEVPGSSTSVAKVVEEACTRLPGLEKALKLLQERGMKPVIMVDGRYADPEDPVHDGAEVAILPPASGGASEARIVRGRVSVDEVISRVASRASREGAGALVIFVGFVKGVVEGNEVRSLDYEAYEPYASKILKEIADKYASLSGVTDVIIYHRVGSLKPGEPTIYVFVSAKDRKTAFKVAAEALEEVKHRAPIFKLERRSDGDYWVMGDGVRVPRKLGEVR
jgi:molybdopterin synthase catalytic subunit